jgi:hypothetical protein
VHEHHLTLVLIGVGIRDSGLLREGRGWSARWTFPPPKYGKDYNREAATQTERRFDLVDLDPFRYDTPESIAAWVAHLASIEDLLWPRPDRLPAMPAGDPGLVLVATMIGALAAAVAICHRRAK